MSQHGAGGLIVAHQVPYNSLSTAASMARKSVIGAPPGRKYPQTNGWTFWNYYDTEVGALVEIDRPRQQYLKQVREPGASAANEWRKSQKGKTDKALSSRAEAYQGFFQKLIDILREEYSFTDARVGQPGNWYSFSARLSGLSGITYGTCFSRGSRVRAELYIDKGSVEENRHLFEYLKSDKEQIEQGFGEPFEWEPLDEKRACRIAVYRPGSIEDSEEVLDEILNWAIDRLLKLKEVFEPHLRRYGRERKRGVNSG